MPSYDTIKKDMTVAKLKEYLRKRGKPVSGAKDALVRRVQLFWNDPVLSLDSDGSQPRSSTSSTPPSTPTTPTTPSDIQLSNLTESNLAEERKIFDVESLNWRDVLAEKVAMPKAYNMETIYTFLSLVFVAATDINLRDMNEALNVGTEKPTVKGREMYISGMVTKAIFLNIIDASLQCISNGNLLNLKEKC